MLKFNNPFKKEGDEPKLTLVEKGLVAKDIRTMCVSILKAVLKNANPLTMPKLNLPEVAKFGVNVWRTWNNHKEIAISNREALANLLRQNSFYCEAAAIAQDVYNETEGVLPGGWHRTDEFDNLKLVDKNTGLNSFVYVRETSEGEEFVYANAGTDKNDIKDWQANVDQLYGESKQYEQAALIASILSASVDHLTFVGHSLGGGIATNNALRTHRKAVVFNPAGLSGKTLSDIEGFSFDEEEIENLVTAFIATNDILNWSQDVLSDCSIGFDEPMKRKSLMPKSFGKKYYVYPHQMNPVESHSIRLMINKLDEIRNLCQ